ncbi:Voltage-dependent T-type calcium channel subunit alpha-1H [Halotydeus destructor]|nr:Voltage-dependent T-type calcium channel subunit alpha-1H [Halotydeus destructor]
MIAIIVNCITLGMYHPCADEVCVSSKCKLLQLFDDFIFVFFALEMTIKMVAMGVRGTRGAYLSETWNRLDMFIVIAGSFEYVLDVGNINLSAIRTVRVLRPLRAINRIPSMRILVMLLLDTLPMLGNVLLLCFFVFFIFGIIGVQLWAGMLRQRCFSVLPDNVSLPLPMASHYQLAEVTDRDFICSKDSSHGLHKCRDLPPTKRRGALCSGQAPMWSDPADQLANESWCVNWNQYYSDCRAGPDNPFQGTISFDNVGMAWTAIFLVISLEGWTEIMYYVQDAHSFWDWIYFVLLIVIGSFFMINLCLVVIATQFSETKKRELERMRQERAKYQQSSSTLASNTDSEPTNCYNAIIKYLAHLGRKTKRRAWRWYKAYRRKRRKKQQQPKGSSGAPDVTTLGEMERGLVTDHDTEGRGSSGDGQACLLTTTPASGRNGKKCRLVDWAPAPASKGRLSSSILASRGDDICNHIKTTHSKGPTNASPSAVSSPPSWIQNEEESYIPSPLMMAPQASPEKSEVEAFSAERSWNESYSKKGTQCPKSSAVLPVACVSTGGHLTASFHSNYGLSTLAGQEVNSKHDTGRHCSAPTLLVGQSPSPLFLLPGSKATPADEVEPQGSDSISNTSLGIEWTHGSWEEPNEPRLVAVPKAEPVKQQQESDDESEDDEADFRCILGPKVSCCLNTWSQFTGVINKLVNNKYFQRFIFLAILFNTLFMGIEYHNQPQGLTLIVEYSNLAFTAIFATEMVLKLLGDGCYKYVDDGFNVFDAIVVVVSLMEWLESDSEGSGLSVLRTFRLLRILKLVRFMPALKRQLVIMLRTLDNVAVFFALLVLFIFIFSCLGMHLFGGKFCTKLPSLNSPLHDSSPIPSLGVTRLGHPKSTHEPCTCQHLRAIKYYTRDHASDLRVDLNLTDCACDRKNFDNFLWATVTVFQILTQEDWNVVLFNGMERTNHWAALYFVFLMTFGNYVLFNLLVAILVEGFSTQDPIDSNENESSSDASEEIKDEKLVYFYDPNDDLEREIQFLSNPPGALGSQSFNAKLDAIINSPPTEGGTLGSASWYPPRITHTAATPQGSPHAMDMQTRCLSALDSYDNSVFSSPARLALQFVSHPSIISIDKSPSLESYSNQVETLPVPNRGPAVLSTKSSIKGICRPVDKATPEPARRDSVRSSRSTAQRSSKSTASGEHGSDLARSTPAKVLEVKHFVRGSSLKVARKTTFQVDRDEEQQTPRRNSTAICGYLGSAGLSSKAKHGCNGRTSGRPCLTPSNSVARDQYEPGQYEYPGSPSAFSVGKRFSVVHEVRTLSPGNSLSGIFYCSSVVSRKNSNATQSSKGDPEQEANFQQERVSSLSKILRTKRVQLEDINGTERAKKSMLLSTGPGVMVKGVDGEDEEETSHFEGLARIKSDRKFCLYFKWTDWMSKHEQWSLFLFAPRNPLRQQCKALTDHKFFDYMILMFISLNCVTLAMERPKIPPWSLEREFLTAANYVFTIVFALEMALKVVANGMWYGDHCYFSSGWNVMDGSLVGVSLVDVVLSFVAQKSPKIFVILRVFRLLRSLRPLRQVNADQFFQWPLFREDTIS